MKKRLFAVLVSLCMIVSVLPAVAFADGSHGDHADWTELSGTINELGLPSGNYVLTGDVTLGEHLTRNESVTICLNGHKIDGNTRSLGNVTICDCTGNGNMYNFTEMYNISLSNVKLRDCEITGSATIDGNTTIYAGCTIVAGGDESITINSNTTITSGVEIEVTGTGILSLNGANVQSTVTLSTPYSICNITGGTISSSIVVKGGTCNITGGTISSPHRDDCGYLQDHRRHHIHLGLYHHLRRSHWRCGGERRQLQHRRRCPDYRLPHR